MNPEEVLDDILEAIFDNDDLHEAAQLMKGLHTHIAGGGASPAFNMGRGEKMIDCLSLLLEDYQ